MNARKLFRIKLMATALLIPLASALAENGISSDLPPVSDDNDQAYSTGVVGLEIPQTYAASAQYEYWTSERMRNAQPMDLIIVNQPLLQKLNNRADGTRIQQVVGALGFMANVPRSQHWNTFGYPAAAPFDGQTLNTCQAGHGTDDTIGTPEPVGIGCDMTGGSSGGPWVLDFKRLNDDGNYLNGVNSYGYSSLPNVMFSPYFGDAFLNLRAYAISQGA
jgi:hypothetical protein